jgi:hypothetical protein
MYWDKTAVILPFLFGKVVDHSRRNPEISAKIIVIVLVSLAIASVTVTLLR